VRDAGYLAVVAALAVGMAAAVIGGNRWLDANAVPVELRASALGAPAPIYQVAAGAQVRVTFANDGPTLLVCTMPGAPKLELNPRPGQEQAARFALPGPGTYTLACAPLDAAASVVAGMGMGGAALPAATFEVR